MEKILLVDDEQSVLDGFQRQLRKQYDISTAISGEEGLKQIAEKGPFSVILSDMRMPVMDGIQFLMEACRAAPDSVRMMLTGNSDQKTAIDAINRGAIFRFLVKPCSQVNLTAAIEAGIEQYRLITAEKELLEKTLKGSINVLVDILSLSNPIAFSQAMRLKKYASQIARQLNLYHEWQYEVAAMLSCIGFINVPTDTIARYISGAAISKKEEEMIAAVSETTGMLLAGIPRLYTVASIITQRDFVHKGKLDFATEKPQEMIRIGAKLLKLITDFDLMLLRNHRPEEAIDNLARDTEVYDKAILKVLRRIDVPLHELDVRYVAMEELKKGMIIDMDIENEHGVLVIPKGYEVTDTTVERLKNFIKKQNSVGAIRVRTTVYSE